jgi:hypothetical protein
LNSAALLLFPLALLLHNIEEAIWLPEWSAYAGKYHRKVDPHSFYFALISVTVLAFLSTALILVFPETAFFRWAYYGFLAAMMINIVAPHLLATIALRRYTPGLITGAFMIWPVDGLLIYKAIQSDLLSLPELALSTIGVGTLLLILLPLFFKAGKLVSDYKQSDS